MPNPNRKVYRVYVVDPRGSGKVLMDGKSVIAVSESEAQMKAGVGQAIAEAQLDFDQVDIYCDQVAEFVRPKRETQKVVIAKEDEKS